MKRGAPSTLHTALFQAKIQPTLDADASGSMTSNPTSATAHAFLVDQGISLPDQPVSYIGYDDVHAALLVASDGVLSCYDTTIDPEQPPTPSSFAANGQGSANRLRFQAKVDCSGPILAVRLSLDGKLLAVQRTLTLLEFVNVETGNTFLASSYKGKYDIRTFFFTEKAENYLVVVSSRGLEISTLLPSRNGLRLRERIKVPVSWAVYTYETRIVMVGGGPAAASVAGWQFTAAASVKLPVFELALAPMPAAAAAAARVTAADVRLLKLYGRVYCAFIDHVTLKLRLYRLYTDTVIQQHAYELFSSHVELSTADNTLLLHHTDAGVVMVLDVCADTAMPVANPLPLAWLGPPPSGLQDLREAAGTLQPPAHQTAAYSFDWQWYMPNTILDVHGGRVARVALDLRAVAESCSDLALLVGFLQRRRTPVVPSLYVHPGELLLGVMKTALQERLPMAALRQIFDEVNAGYAASQAAAEVRGAMLMASSKAPHAVQVISPQDVALQVFKWMHDEEVVDSPYLAAAVTEYKCSAEAAGVALPVYLQLLPVDMLLQQQQLYQVVQTLYCRSAGSSVHMAAHLEEAAAESGDGPTIRQLAWDIHARLAITGAQQPENTALERYCRKLLDDGQVLRACRVARNHGLKGVQPSAFLEAAACTADPAVFTAVFRMFADAVRPALMDLDAARRHFCTT